MRYLLFCYGLSFIPAFIFIFVSTHQRGRIYGPAIIWCWIDIKWDFLRILFLYGWIWYATQPSTSRFFILTIPRLAIVFAFAVYVKAGLVIWHKRRHLNGFLNPLNENPFAGIITTDITVTTSDFCPTKAHELDGSMPHEPPPARPATTQLTPADGIDHYSVTVNVDPQKKSPQPAILRMRSLTREAANDEINAEAWLYARVAILFYFALLITWVRILFHANSAYLPKAEDTNMRIFFFWHRFHLVLTVCTPLRLRITSTSVSITSRPSSSRFRLSGISSSTLSLHKPRVARCGTTSGHEAHRQRAILCT